MGYVAGSLILMADYSHKDISEICTGDIILGADLNSSIVTESFSSKLGNRRIMSFLGNKQVRFTDCDVIWAKDSTRQWWWTENAHELQLAWKNMRLNSKNHLLTGIKIIDSMLVSYDVEFATINGFEKKTVIDVTEEYSENTFIPMIKTERFCPVIINDFVVGGGICEHEYDYTKFNWMNSYNQLRKSDKLDLIKNRIV
jgi:hypothetical protein